MNALCQSLAEHGGGLLAGVTGLLLLGCAGMLCQRSPIHRQRAGELAVLGVLVWVVLALIPLPRVTWSRDWLSLRAANTAAAPESSPQAGLADRPWSVEGSPPLWTPPSNSRADVPNVLEPVPAFDGERSLASADGPAVLPAAASSTVRRRITLGDLGFGLAAAYGAGFLGCAAWLILGRMLLLRVLWSAQRPEPWLEGLYREVSGRQRRRVRLLVSPRSTRAISFGLWRPTILLPKTACRAEQREAVRHVLLHELVHVRQGDAWGQLLFNLAFPLLYFHPLYWWIRAQAHLAAELVADDQAAAASVKESYVGALVDLARGCGRQRIVCWSSHGMSGSPSQFYRRMQMLLTRTDRLAFRCSRRWRLIYPAAWILVVALLAGTLGVRPLVAQEPDAVQRLERQVVELKSQLDALRSEAESLRKDRAGLQQEIGSRQQRTTKTAPHDQATDRPAAKAVAETAQQKSVRVYRLSVTLAPELDGVVKVLKGAVLKGAVLKGAVLKGAVRSFSIGSDARTGSVIVSADAEDHATIGEVLGVLEQLARRAGPQDLGQTRLAPDRAGPEQPEAKGGVDQKSRSASMESMRTASGELDPMLGTLMRLAPSVKITQPAGTDTLVVTGDRAQVQAFLDAVAAMENLAQKRVAQERASAGDGRTEAPRSVPDPVVRQPVPDRRVRPPAVPGADPGQAAAEGPPLDLVGLVNSYSDASEKLLLAELECRRLEDLKKSHAVSTHDAAAGEIRLKAARSRLALLRSVVVNAMQSTKVELEVLHSRLAAASPQAAQADPVKIQIIRAETRLVTLQGILKNPESSEVQQPPTSEKRPAAKF